MFARPHLHTRQTLVIASVVAAHALALGLVYLAPVTQLPAPVPAAAPLEVQWITSPTSTAAAAAPSTSSTTAPSPPAPPAKTSTKPPIPSKTADTPPSSTNEASPSTTASASPAPAADHATPATSTPAGPAASPPAIAPKIELPSSNADYLHNPRPPYPALSKRLGEQGKVVLRVFIEANGSASQASVLTSSGYDRLDQTALQTVLRWRYVPGKRNGEPEAMWFNIPIQFILE